MSSDAEPHDWFDSSCSCCLERRGLLPLPSVNVFAMNTGRPLVLVYYCSMFNLLAGLIESQHPLDIIAWERAGKDGQYEYGERMVRALLPLIKLLCSELFLSSFAFTRRNLRTETPSTLCSRRDTSRQSLTSLFSKALRLIHLAFSLSWSFSRPDTSARGSLITLEWRSNLFWHTPRR